MKKLFTTLALSGAFAVGAQAQDLAFVQPIFVSAPTEINCTDSFEFGWAFVNHGPYTIQPTDTFGFNDYEAESETNGWIGYVTEPVAPGDTFFVNVWNSHYDRIGWLVNDAGEVVTPPFADGSLGFFVRFFGFYTNPDGAGFVPRTDLVSTDPNPDDDIFPDAGILIDINCGGGSNSVDNVNKQAINVYPNPTSGELNFSQVFNTTSDAVANVYDITGKVVMTKNFGTQFAGTNNFQLNVADLPAGTYTLEFITNDNRGVSKFTVAK